MGEGKCSADGPRPPNRLFPQASIASDMVSGGEETQKYISYIMISLLCDPPTFVLLLSSVWILTVWVMLEARIEASKGSGRLCP